MVFVMDKPWLSQKLYNETLLGFRSGKPFLQIALCQVSLVLKYPRRTMKSAGGTLSTDYNKAEYSELLLGT